MEMRLTPLFYVLLLLEGDQISSVAASERKRELEKNVGLIKISAVEKKYINLRFESRCNIKPYTHVMII